MRRADRLFQIVQLLRRRRSATTAAHIAERLGISERTVYRDIADLNSAGTPIAWCELRHDFRNFRLDRANELVTLDQTFEETGKDASGLADALRTGSGQVA